MTKKRSNMTESRDFREHFRCKINVTHQICCFAELIELISNEGWIHHLLWALVFIKSYNKDKTMWSLANIRDPETLRKWVWLFIDSIAELESSMVSNIFWRSYISLISPCLFFPWHIFFENRFDGEKSVNCLIWVYDSDIGKISDADL